MREESKMCEFMSIMLGFCLFGIGLGLITLTFLAGQMFIEEWVLGKLKRKKAKKKKTKLEKALYEAKRYRNTGIIRRKDRGCHFTWHDIKWLLFVYRNKNNFIMLDTKNTLAGTFDSSYYLLKKHKKQYILSFIYTWQFTLHKGSSINEIYNSTTSQLTIHGNKADYITEWQLTIGENIEKWHIKNLKNKIK